MRESAFPGGNHPSISLRARLAAARFGRIPLLAYLSLLGPGLVAANAGNDAGGIATYTQIGASYGYDLLWLVAWSTIGLIIVQEMCARMGAVTGKGLSELIREEFGPRWTVFAMLTLLVANGLTTISEFAGIAASLEIIGVSRYLSVPISATLIWWLVARGSYGHVEQIFVAMTLPFFAYPISAILAKPDWGLALYHTAVPVIHPDSQFIFLLIATVGTTLTPYMQIFIQSSVVDKGITIAEYRNERREVIFGSIFGNLISYVIVITAAATLFAARTPITTAADAALALTPLAGPFAGLIFAFGLLGASILAAGVVPLATAFSITEAFGWEKGIGFLPSEAPAFYFLFTSLIVIGAVVTLIPGVPLIPLLLIVQVINGLLLPILLVFIVRLAGDPEVMGTFRNGPVYRVLAWAITVLIGGVAMVMLGVTLFGSLLGI